MPPLFGFLKHLTSFVPSLNFTVPVFRDAIDVPLVVRKLHKSKKEVLTNLSEALAFHDLVSNLGTYEYLFFKGEERTWSL